MIVFIKKSVFLFCEDHPAGGKKGRMKRKGKKEERRKEKKRKEKGREE